MIKFLLSACSNVVGVGRAPRCLPRAFMTAFDSENVMLTGVDRLYLSTGLRLTE